MLQTHGALRPGDCAQRKEGSGSGKSGGVRRAAACGGACTAGGRGWRWMQVEQASGDARLMLDDRI